MKKYKALLFDLDDTLIDNKENVKYAFKKVIKEYNYDDRDEEFEKFYDLDRKYWESKQNGEYVPPIEVMGSEQNMLDWVRAQRFLLYFDNSISLDQAIEINTKYMEYLCETVIPVKGVYDTLESLSKNYKIFVVTNGPSVATKSKIDKINCSNFIENIYSADMFGVMKPNIKYMESLKNILNDYNDDDFLIIGDSLKSDIELGMNCNIDTCWFNYNNEDLTDNHKPTMIINELIELIDKL